VYLIEIFGVLDLNLGLVDGDEWDANSEEWRWDADDVI